MNDICVQKKFLELSIDERIVLARDNHELFEKLSRQAIEENINSARNPASRARLEQIQQLIDNMLIRAELPLERLGMMEALFYIVAHGPGGFLDTLGVIDRLLVKRTKIIVG